MHNFFDLFNCNVHETAFYQLVLNKIATLNDVICGIKRTIFMISFRLVIYHHKYRLHIF